MRSILRLLVLICAVASPFAACADVNPDWTAQVKPFQIADNLYYVGSRDLGSYLITTSAGDILINSNLDTSPPQIRQSVEQLGFHWRDIKILLISHAHSDHASGSAAILKQTGAKYMVMDGDVDVVQSGGRTDFAYGPKQQYKPAHVDRVLHDGDTVSLGGITLTAHKTAGHTRGCTTWTLRTHVRGEPAGVLRNVVIVGSFGINPGYRLVASHGRAESYPGIAADYTHTYSVMRSLPCDIFLGSHSQFFRMLSKLEQMPLKGNAVWVDPEECKKFVAQSQQVFENELARQKAAASQP